MQLIKLDPSFYADHTHLVQALDNHNGVWDAGKVRGYGIVVITINKLTFGIPLRTNITHSAAYLTVRNINPNTKIKGKGLDFSKALVEHKKLLSKQHHITQLFDKYLTRYIDAVRKKDIHILNSNEYRHTTLQNYHVELGI